MAHLKNSAAGPHQRHNLKGHDAPLPPTSRFPQRQTAHRIPFMVLSVQSVTLGPMKRVLPLAAALLLGAAFAQMETRIPPDPLVIIGVGQDLPASAGVVALRGRYSTHVRIVDATTGEQKREIWLPPEIQHSVPPALSGDGKWLAVALTPDPASSTPRVGILNVSASNKPDEAKPFAMILMSAGLKGTSLLALSRDGSRLAAGNKNGYVQLWDAQGATRLTTIQSDTKLEPNALNFSPDGTLFAPMFRGQTKTRIFDSKTGQLKTTLGGVGVGQFSPDGRGFLASRGRLVSLADGKEQQQPLYLKGASGVIGYSADGTRILIRRTESDAQGRDWLELRETLLGRTLGAITRISDGWPEFLSPDGTALIGGDGQGGVRILPIAPK